MANNQLRIIIDTNLWISFLITKDFTKLDEIIFTHKCVLVFSEELLEEFIEVARRPKFRRYFSLPDIEEILETIDEYADLVKVESSINLCRDVKDNFLLSLSLDGNADYLITGDEDLLELIKFNSTTITTITDFLKLYN
jgi:uncharacterized protein